MILDARGCGIMVLKLGISERTESSQRQGCYGFHAPWNGTGDDLFRA